VAIRRKATVVDPDLVLAQIREFVVDDTHTSDVIVELASGVRLALPTELLGPAPDGGYQVGVRWAELVAQQAPTEIPVIAEEVSVHTRPVIREELRVQRRIVTEDRDVETPVWRERIVVEKIPRDVFVEKMPEVRHEGDTLVVPCVEEVVVTERRLHLREELRIRVVREQVIDRQTISLRRHHIDVVRETNPKKQGDSS
jgi:stress response protein YsnF